MKPNAPVIRAGKLGIGDTDCDLNFLRRVSIGSTSPDASFAPVLTIVLTVGQIYEYLEAPFSGDLDSEMNAG